MMRWFYKIPLQLRSLFRKSRVEQELTEELCFHLEKVIEEKVAKGMTPEEARYAALRELGGLDQIKEECRDMRRVNYLENFFQDVRYGLRMLVKNPGFTAVAVIILALGIGANTAIFSVLNPVLLRPLPYRDPARLMLVFCNNLAKGFRNYGASPPDFRALRERNHSFQSLSAFYGSAFNLTGKQGAEQLQGQIVSSEFFSTLGVTPLLGRTFLASEEQWGSQHVVVVSESFWRDHLGADPNLSGVTLRLNGEQYSVVGVMPASFRFFDDKQVWVPMAWAPGMEGRVFNETDGKSRPPVAIVNKALARRFWPNQDPIGKVIWMNPPEGLIQQLEPGVMPPGYHFPRQTVIGVVDDVRYGALAKDALPVMYAPMAQGDWLASMFVTVRTQGDPNVVAPSIRKELAQIDKDQPMANIATMEEILADSVTEPRLESLLLGPFGGLGLVLAAVGIYGVTSYSVTLRTHEIGIRMALGAKHDDVLKMVIEQGMKLAVVGVAVGVVASLALTRLIASLLYGIKPTDPLTFALVSIGLAAVALLASYIPARRATKVDPMVALRHE